MTLWLYVTKDEYELPLAVADSLSELARMIGMSEGGISSTMSRARKLGYECVYKKVEVEDWSEN